VELLRVFSGEPKQQTAGVLNDAEVDRVVAFIESALDFDFDLSAMARVLDRDVFSFTRAFKAATGETPHRFVIGRRIDRAQQMLRYGTEPLADIAYACGFSSQAHMTSTFTKHAGISPGRYRKEVRS
ncbi:MAG: AraC family transcriptional regulator, partial [Pseudomonadota bacterium]